jgi:hypothetical protein
MFEEEKDQNKPLNPDELSWIPNAWMQHMRKGEFSAAWTLSDKVLAAGVNRDPTLPRHYQGVWDGTPLNGKRVLVRCYHGLGDTIQFIRYASKLKEIAAEVIVWAQPPLLELLKTVAGIDQVFALHDGTPEVPCDVDCEVMELPFIFRSTLETIPAQVPYLHTKPIHLSSGPQLAVGLVWQAGDWNQARCLPFSALQPLAEITGIKLYIMQANAEVAGWKEGFGIHPGEFSLTDYAGVIRGLDLLITPDSMPAHLAGALNVPVWTLLHQQSDWRWMDERSDSPWYPSMRLFRQQKNNTSKISQDKAWDSVIAQVTEALKKLRASVPQSIS